MRHRSLDLVLVGGFAVVAPLATTLTGAPALRALPGLALVLVAPGYALSVAFLPSEPRDLFVRTMLTLGSSLAAAVLVTLALDAAGIELGATSWATALAAVTLLACAAGAWRRRGDLERAPAALAPRLPEGRLTPTGIGVVAAALVLVSAAFAVARMPSPHVKGFTSLWALPVRCAQGTFRFGIRSEERSPTSYLVKVESGGRTVFVRSVALAPGQTWSDAATVGRVRPGFSKSIRISLVDQARPDHVYRRVHLTLGSAF